MRESQKRANENYQDRMKGAGFERIKIRIAPEDKDLFYELAAKSRRKHRRNLKKIEV